jgi:two-component sensor histidine kinase
VSRLDSSRNILTTFKLTDNLIRKFYRSPNGKIWVAMTKEGLGAWNKEPQPVMQYFKNIPGDAVSLTSNQVYDMADAGNEKLWISTYGGGLHLFNTVTNRFRHIASSANLLEGLSTDTSGTVWMISSGNLHSYNPTTDTYTSYELPDMERSGGVIGYIYKDEDGMMYAGGNRYYIKFNPAEIKKERKEPEVILTDFRVFNKSMSHLLFSNSIRLKYNQNFFTIEFSSPHFSGNEKIYYSYMLEGVDKDWVDAGTRNVASYPNTGDGNFVFKVRASYESGRWGNNITALKIKVVPPFWRTWWFYSLLGLFITGAAYALYRYRVNELVKRQAIRNKIAQDLHDNVGSTLSSISVYSQVAQIQGEEGNKEELNQVLDKISTTSNDMIAEMNDIVWAINPANDNMEKIIRRMESFAKPLLAARNMQFYFNCTDEALKLNLDMEKRKNFFLVFKEAVNNAIKYSGASSLLADIAVHQQQLRLRVEDNGIGFNQQAELTGGGNSLGGNGLHNMQARAKELKGTLHINSKPGNGTKVELVMPL